MGHAEVVLVPLLGEVVAVVNEHSLAQKRKLRTDLQVAGGHEARAVALRQLTALQAEKI